MTSVFFLIIILNELPLHPFNYHLTFIEAEKHVPLQRLMHAHDERLKRIDMKIILQLDQKVLNQQVTLEKAGLPLFFATNRGEDIAVQMKIIEYIIRLSQITPRPFEGVARSA